MVYESNSPDETLEIAKEIAEKAKPGDIYCLSGDLGTGKTLFAKGFAKGIGVVEHVDSPTFTIVKQYVSGRMPFYHFDVYRIGDVEEMFEIGYSDYFYGDGVCLIEWSELIKEILPIEVYKIKISKSLAKGYNYRKIELQIW